MRYARKFMVWLADAAGAKQVEGHTAIEALARQLAAGAIAAVKGLGGFHLACDATNPIAVGELRRRKHRPHKALAVMVPDLDTARRIGHVPPEAEALLTGSRRPITLLAARPDRLAPGIAPDTDEIGVMLPYTPLHHILLDAFTTALPPGHLPALVMNGDNATGPTEREPSCPVGPVERLPSSVARAFCLVCSGLASGHIDEARKTLYWI